MLAFWILLGYNHSCVVKYKQTIKYALLAHLVEHLTLNQGVRGSSPRRRTCKGPSLTDVRAVGLGLFILFKNKLGIEM